MPCDIDKCELEQRVGVLRMIFERLYQYEKSHTPLLPVQSRRDTQSFGDWQQKLSSNRLIATTGLIFISEDWGNVGSFSESTQTVTSGGAAYVNGLLNKS